MAKPSKKSKPAAKPAVPPPPTESAFKQAFLGWYGLVGMTLSYVTPIKLPWAEGYAKEHWRHAMGSLMVVLLLLAGAVGLALHLLNVNDFKQQIVDYVKQHQQRDLVIEGDIHLKIFPSLGIDTGRMSLSQRNSGRKFASVDNARLYVAWWPLVTKQVRVERVVLDGLHANLVRHADGSTNFDDLLQPADWMGGVQFEVEKIRVLESSLDYQDEGAGLVLSAHDLRVETGRLAEGAAGEVKTSMRLQSQQHQLDLRLQLAGHVLVESAKRRYEVANLEGSARGDVLGMNDATLEVRGTLGLLPAEQQFTLDKFSSTLRGRRDGRTVEARLSAANVQRDKQAWRGSDFSMGASVQRDKNRFSASLDLPAFEADGKQVRGDKLQVALDLFPGEAGLQGKFSSAASLDLAARELRLNALNGNWSASHPLLASKLNGASTGTLRLDWPAQEFKIDLKTRVDETELATSVQVQDFKAPAWVFDVATNTLDLDRYLVADWLARLQGSVQAADFDVLKTLNVKGKLRAEDLRVTRLKARQFAAELRAGGGALAVEPMQARLYGGSLQGGVTLNAGEAPQLALRQRLNNVQIDALLADLLHAEARISGRAAVVLDLNAQGGGLPALRKSLTGNASMTLARGSLGGVNLREALVSVREQIGQDGAVQKDTLRLTESTPFTELKASWDFSGGQARSGDFVLRSPEFNVKGEGSLNLETLELQARAQAGVAAGLRRASAGDLAELSGLTVPMQINGPWQSATVRYELSAATGAGVTRLAKGNQARVAAQTAPPAASAPGAAAAGKPGAAKPAPARASTAK